MTSVSMLDAALWYVDLGMSVIPIRTGTKDPSVRRWTPYQSATADPKKLKEWFGGAKNRETRNREIALVMGQVSGGLCCRDFDAPGAFDNWAAEFPDLAAVLPKVQTGRGSHGWHVYCRMTPQTSAKRMQGRCFLTLSDGEFRVERCYCLAPPSIHPSGGSYRWVDGWPEDVPELDPLEAGFLSEWTRATESTGKTETAEWNGEDGESQSEPRELKSTDAIEGGGVDPEAIHEAITRSLPTATGQRNRRVFDFVRWLKAIPSLVDADPNDLEPFVREWHDKALPYIGTEPFDETMLDFLLAWDNVKFPAGEEAMTVVLERARGRPVPKAAEKYETDALRFLVAICQELQRASGDRPFYLSCRTAGRLLETDHKQANRWLMLLTKQRVLQEVEKGSQATGRATRYRYLPPLE